MSPNSPQKFVLRYNNPFNYALFFLINKFVVVSTIRLTPKNVSFGCSPDFDLNSQFMMMWLSKTLSSLVAKNLPGLYMAIIKSACGLVRRRSGIRLPSVPSVPK